MVHAEKHHYIDWLSHKLISEDKTRPHHHAESRPMAVEREATHRAITLAETADAPPFLVHVSGREAVEQIAWARSQGLLVYGETCPQYLFLTAEDIDRLGFEGAKFMCSPPTHDAANPEVLWRALEDDMLQFVSSDHSPSRFEGHDGKKANGEDAPSPKSPTAFPASRPVYP